MSPDPPLSFDKLPKGGGSSFPVDGVVTVRKTPVVSVLPSRVENYLRSCKGFVCGLFIRKFKGLLFVRDRKGWNGRYPCACAD